jgi:predicted metal-dependent peptidase
MDNNTSLAKAGKSLILKEGFYGLFLIKLNKHWSDRVKTAGVGLNGINYQLIINPNFWNSLSLDHHRGLLKHELLHIIFGHVSISRKRFSDPLLANMAEDIEINCYIDPSDLPDGGITIHSFPSLMLEPKKGSRYYYDKLKEAADKGSKVLKQFIEDIEAGGSAGKDEKGKDINAPQNNWEEFDALDETTKKIVLSQLEYQIKETADQVVKSRGTVPGEVKMVIENMIVEPPKFDWRGYLRNFVGGSTRTYTKKTRRKNSKRFPDSPGQKIMTQKHILLGIDTSGSVSTGELVEFLGEMKHIYKTGTEITVVQFDSAISNISKFNSKDKDYQIHGRGGTDFTPFCNYYNENHKKVCCAMIFTDGEAPAPTKTRGKLLWVLSSKSKDNANLPGQTIKLN